MLMKTYCFSLRHVGVEVEVEAEGALRLSVLCMPSLDELKEKSMENLFKLQSFTFIVSSKTYVKFARKVSRDSYKG